MGKKKWKNAGFRHTSCICDGNFTKNKRFLKDGKD